jgi:hypothetical protein
MTGKTVRKNSKTRVKKLNQEALKSMGISAKAIVQGLVDSSTHGNAVSAKLLMDLAEQEADAKQNVKRRPILTLGQRLAAEPKLPPGTPIADWEDDDEDAA